jgi:hypothetical protein
VGTPKGKSTPKGKKTKKYSPPTPQTAKAARTTRASKHAVADLKARPTAEMASASADVSRSTGEEGGNNVHEEQEMVVNPARHGAGSVPAPDPAANIPEGQKGPGGEQPERSEEEIRDRPRPLAMWEAAARVIPRPRLAGAAMTDLIRTTDIQRPGKGR